MKLRIEDKNYERHQIECEQFHIDIDGVTYTISESDVEGGMELRKNGAISIEPKVQNVIKIN